MSTLFVDTINEKTSGNGIEIPGHVVQVVDHANSSQVTVTSSHSTYTKIMEASITPKFSGSKFIITACLPYYSNNVNANGWTNSIYIRLYEQEGSGSNSVAAGYEHPGPITSMEFSQVIPVLFTTGAKSTVQSYTYGIYGAATIGGDSHYFGRSSGGYNAYPRMTIMEIAQ